MEENEKPNYTATCNLLQTTFSLRADAQKREPEMLKRWLEEGLYQAAQQLNEGNQQFLLHDGPPYANGPLHMGHALNKVLKDMITKYYRMSGRHCPFVPGWDCHGLPIELNVTKKNGWESTKDQIDRCELRRLCREYAQQWIENQKKDFVRLGVLADWDNPYLTMSYGYQAGILRAFAAFVEGGYVHRQQRTVPWCSSCQTVLAKAEIEYKMREDPSCYVLFPLTADSTSMVLRKLPGLGLESVILHLVAWTTTPWTLPLNRALVVNPSAKYALLHVQYNSKPSQPAEAYIFVGATEANELCQQLASSGLRCLKLLGEVDADAFRSATVHHPFVPNLVVPVLLDHMVVLREMKAREDAAHVGADSGDLGGDVSSDQPASQSSQRGQAQGRKKGKGKPSPQRKASEKPKPGAASGQAATAQDHSPCGTQVVHAAPGCGPEDYDMAMRHAVEVYSPLTSEGRYTAQVVPAELAGQLVATEGQRWVLSPLLAVQEAPNFPRYEAVVLLVGQQQSLRTSYQ